MSTIRTIRVRAKGTGLLALIDTEGRTLLGMPALNHRWAGRDAAGNPMVDTVHEDAYYHRAIQHGDLELVGDDEAASVVLSEGGV